MFREKNSHPHQHDGFENTFSCPPACGGAHGNYALFWNSGKVIASDGGNCNQFEPEEMESAFKNFIKQKYK